MPPTHRHLEAERAFRRLLIDGGLADPDEVHYTDESVLFLWSEPKLAVAVDLDDLVTDELAA
jgi:hypothetical protein